MRKYLFILFTLLCLTTYSQTFSVNELESLCRKNLDEFDTYVIKKNYVFVGSNEDENFDYRNYAFDENYSENNASNWLDITIFKNKIVKPKAGVRWSTLKINEYISLKNQLIKSGYKFVKTEIENDYTFYIYKKVKYEAKIHISKTITADNIERNSYGIVITLLE